MLSVIIVIAFATTVHAYGDERGSQNKNDNVTNNYGSRQDRTGIHMHKH